MNKESYYQIVVGGRPITPVLLRPTVEALVADVRSKDPNVPIQVFEVCHYDVTSEFVQSNDQRLESLGNSDGME